MLIIRKAFFYGLKLFTVFNYTNRPNKKALLNYLLYLRTIEQTKRLFYETII